VVFPAKGHDPWSKLPEFTIMMQDLAPIYKKPEIKGFDQCHDLSIQKQVKKMNTIKVKLNTKDPKRERE